ncbi:CRISPR-associated endonuclease Cas2 [Thermodesulfovibrio sp. 3907-1M]|uniref:CRISPR-associated endoribonuclease Cas2 n=1 Tax=Thermodesulfovibrio autotrophicus TaxID=3118333 RepID=A0AAU8H053_9BACT
MRYRGKRFNEYVVVYDISDNRERLKVDRILKNYGFRVQKSVFECKLNEFLKKKLIAELQALNVKTGFIKIYLLTDIVDAKTLGRPSPSIDDKDAFIV